MLSSWLHQPSQLVINFLYWPFNPVSMSKEEMKIHLLCVFKEPISLYYFFQSKILTVVISIIFLTNAYFRGTSLIDLNWLMFSSWQHRMLRKHYSFCLLTGGVSISSGLKVMYNFHIQHCLRIRSSNKRPEHPTKPPRQGSSQCLFLKQVNEGDRGAQYSPSQGLVITFCDRALWVIINEFLKFTYPWNVYHLVEA